MNPTIFHYPLLLLFFLPSVLPISPPKEAPPQNFLRCLLRGAGAGSPIPGDQLLTQAGDSSRFASILQTRAQDLKLLTPATRKPVAILTPTRESHVQTAVLCSRTHALELRVRSGGHDMEGLSYAADAPFALLDLINLRSVDVDARAVTAWVQAGAVIGELYHGIAGKTPAMGFPAGICPKVGVGGHISGGGYGYLVRKYGLAADHVLDARLVDASGRIQDRKAMGEDLFWAIRGGGAASFGVILSWKLELVPVPSAVTVFRVRRSPQQLALKLLHQWQTVAPELDDDVTIRLTLNTANSTGGITVQATFTGLFLGGTDRLLPLMQARFPELLLTKQDCIEMAWANSTVFHAGGFPLGQSIDVLLDRSPLQKAFFKTKSDYVRRPIAEAALEVALRKLYEMETGAAEIRMTPFGGEMTEIPATATPYPNRAGTLYQIQYLLQWQEGGAAAFRRHTAWMRGLYAYMAPFVSKNPRAAYVNYRDLELGANRGNGSGGYAQGSVWGSKYFGVNFRRLAAVKMRVDPGNFFRNEQSIPPALI